MTKPTSASAATMYRGVLTALLRRRFGELAGGDDAHALSVALKDASLASHNRNAAMWHLFTDGAIRLFDGDKPAERRQPAEVSA